MNINKTIIIFIEPNSSSRERQSVQPFFPERPSSMYHCSLSPIDKRPREKIETKRHHEIP